MKYQLLHLHTLLDCLTSANSLKGFSELNSILEKYTKILDYTNSYSETYKIATSVYYTDINSIRDNLQVALYADSRQEKDIAFENAKNDLKKDIQALATLIKPAEQPVETAV